MSRLRHGCNPAWDSCRKRIDYLSKLSISTCLEINRLRDREMKGVMDWVGKLYGPSGTSGTAVVSIVEDESTFCTHS
ncbi:hypothetical protein TNIN_49431 [Trichonephila inaurata madagascariensis]|uniref:Uncharacterized protein n=1 Tax=Trichonephila inaurata madagascariensis TaxID=2747483 RepID=A0A8X7C6J0_9ARAC|nr:hypothetical protein TNIN_49431 [Trichonephila inaurata madagascariensis]